MIILGAGLAGCIAAHLFPGSRVLEYQDAENLIGSHRALLRFRSEEISRITGIPFRRVRVTKEVSGGTGKIAAMNFYSSKVAGTLTARSIGSLDPVDRWVAPTDFHARMIDQLEDRVEFSQKIERVSQAALWLQQAADEPAVRGIDRTDEPVLSTIPLSVMLKLTGMENEYLGITLRRSAIYVRRAIVRDCDVFQTCYYPWPHLGLYRASITGDLLIMESVNKPVEDEDLEYVYRDFGLSPKDLLLEQTATVQQFGKIVPLEDVERHAILLRLTQEHGVYSLGRFATWKNLILDDLPQDAARIRELIRMTDYERQIRIATSLS
jgi:hypothetical protein